MPRQQKNHSLNPLLVLPAVVFLWVVTKAVHHINSAAVFATVTGALLFFAWKLLRPRRLRATALAKVYGTIERHMEQLVRRRAQLVRLDPYGKLQTEKWLKEAEYFVTHHIVPVLTGSERSALERCDISLSYMVARRVEATAQDRPSFSGFSNDFTPQEFEIFCAEQLRSLGWDARVTLQSRDQGVDVIAEKAGIRIVLQCKLYSSPVGNKAVQEIAAGKAHEQADHAAVVSNNRYTSAAEQLASTNRVLLLHHSDLVNLDKIIKAGVHNSARLRA